MSALGRSTTGSIRERAGFSPDGKQALFYASNRCGGKCATGSYVVMEKHGSAWKILKDLRGLGPIGVDFFAPNFSTLRLRPVGPLNDKVFTIDLGRNMNVSPQVKKLIISFQRWIVCDGVHRAIQDERKLTDESANNAGDHIAGGREIKIEEYRAMELFWDLAFTRDFPDLV